MSYVFFVEYTKGKRIEITCNSAKIAEKHYKLYHKSPEINAKSWGWEPDLPTLSRQISKKRVVNG